MAVLYLFWRACIYLAYFRARYC